MGSPTPIPATFEQAMERLEEIVSHLESEQLNLDEMVGSYEEGMHLLLSCRQRLESARLRIEAIQTRADAPATLTSFEAGREEEAETLAEKPRATVTRRKSTPAPSRSDADGSSGEITLF